VHPLHLPTYLFQSRQYCLNWHYLSPLLLELFDLERQDRLQVFSVPLDLVAVPNAVSTRCAILLFTPEAKKTKAKI
jgi:hypothetical protein